MISYNDYATLTRKGFQPGMNESGGGGPNLVDESVWNTMTDDEKWAQMGGMMDLGMGDPGYEAARAAIEAAHPGSDTRSIAVSRTPGGADSSKTIQLPDGSYAWSVDNSVHPKESEDWKLALMGTGLVLGGGALANSLLSGVGTEAAAASLPDSYWSALADSGTVASDATAAEVASAGGTALSGSPGAAMSTVPGTIPSVSEYLANPASWASGTAQSGAQMSWMDYVKDLPWKDILSGASDIFAGHRAEQNTEGDFNRSANFAREMWANALRASRPNQTNAWGASRQWVQDKDGNWSQKDSFSPEQQRRADLFNAIAERRMQQAQTGVDPDYERMGLGYLLEGGTTGQRPWSNSRSSSMGGDQLRNLTAPAVTTPNSPWANLPTSPPYGPGAVAPTAPPGANMAMRGSGGMATPVVPSAGGGQLNEGWSVLQDLVRRQRGG